MGPTCPLRFALCLAFLSILVVPSSGKLVKRKTKPPPCDSEIYCHGKLLKLVQTNEIYDDDKTFVDQPLKFSPEEVLENFTKFQKRYKKTPSKAQITKFVNDNFYANDGQEFQPWTPADWVANPKFLSNITDPKLRTWATTLHGFWKVLGRNISEDVRVHPERYSLVPLNFPFIVPGGRFREVYYWDSYWIQRGLLHSEMYSTVKGMIQNFLDLVEKYGYVPNGGRIYYQRSQPPFLTQMVSAYFDATMDIDFLRASLPTLDKEFNFWLEHRMNSVIVNKRRYRAFRYCSDRTGPRPESYRKDYELAKSLSSKGKKELLYTNLQSAAESGWDFSSRWYLPDELNSKALPVAVNDLPVIDPNGQTHNPIGNLTDTHPCQIFPADLNAIMFRNAETLIKLYPLATGDLRRSYVYVDHAKDFKRSIDKLLWDPELGAYFDYDISNKRQIKEFYASSIVPLWAGVDKSPLTASRILAYLTSQKILDFPGGIPSSLQGTGQQWDFPNGWSPSNHMAIEALAQSVNPEARKAAIQLIKNWVGSNYKAFYAQTPNTMFEKYDVTNFGQPGSGGEYSVVAGFGWTNGVVLDLLAKYGKVLEA